MFKRIYARENAPVISDYTVNGAGARTGMAVTVTNAAGKQVSLATGAANLFFLDKDPISTGINAADINRPLSDEEFNTFVNGEYVEMVKGVPGEVFAVDAAAIVNANTAAFLAANYLTANAGKWEPSTNATKYKPTGNTTVSGSMKLYQIMILE